MSTKDQINYEASKSPERLEREIDQQRADIGSTLSALEEKFSPGELFDKALGFARGNGNEFAQNLGASLKSNPVAAILVGVGIAGLMMGPRRSASDYGGYEMYAQDDGINPYDTDETYSGATQQHSSLGEKASQLKAKALHMKESMSSSAHSRRRQWSESSHQMSSNARHQAQRAQETFSRLADEQPLALGAIGIGIGALLGALLPPTRQEDQLLGASADKLKSQAADLARRESETLRQHGMDASREIRDDLQSRSTDMHSQASSLDDSETDSTDSTGHTAPAHPPRPGTPPPRQPLV